MPRIKSPLSVQYTNRHQESLYFQGAEREEFQISVLEHDIIRVQHRPSGDYRLERTWLIVDQDGQIPREGRSRADMQRFGRPQFQLEQQSNTLSLTTDQLNLTIHTGDFHLTWADKAGNNFAADLPCRAYVYDHSGTTIYHYMRRREDERYYGFGERSGSLNKSGMQMTMRNLDTLGYNARTSDPLYKHFPLYITYIPELNIAYGLLYDNLATTTFDMGRELDSIWGLFRYYEADGGDLDYYLLYGSTIEDVVEKIVQLTGKPFLPPRYSLGYLGSTMSYTEAYDAQEQLKQFVELVRVHDIPCDMFHLSSGYTTNFEGERCVFTWNRDRIPDPAQMVDNFHQFNIRLGANVKPYLLKSNPHYDTLAEAGGFLKDPENPSKPAIEWFWSGGAYESAEGSYIDFTSAVGYEWWQSQLQAQLFDYGIDVIWNDNNEFEVWDDELLCDGFGDPLPVGLARPLQTLLMGHASYSATQHNRPDERPFLLSRSGCPGIQRYAQTWSGDNQTSWETLRYNIPMGLGISLSGAPNTGHDVGGFHGEKPDPELFVRWVQNGIFHPRFTIHSWNTDGTVNEPWMYPEMLPHIRDAINFRYRLMPYLYSLFVEAHRTGHPIIRPMIYHFSDDPQTQANAFDFMLGQHLLVASVLEQGARTRRVYPPQTTNWYDYHTGLWYRGGQTIDVDAPLDRFPLLVPEGGIIPMGKQMRYVGELPDDERIVYLFPHRANGQGAFTLTEDDGISLNYQRGEYATVSIHLAADVDRLQITLGVDQARYPIPYATMDFVLPPNETRPIQIDGAALVSDSGTIDRRVIQVQIM